jgi:Ras-related protein Rab-2A
MSVGNYNYLFKFIMVGDTCNFINPLILTPVVGKSNMLIQFTQKKFRGEHEITIGCEFMAKNIIIKERNIRIQVWDTVSLF